MIIQFKTQSLFWTPCSNNSTGQVIHVNQLKLVFPPDNRLELIKYQATITPPQKASQVPSDNSVTDLFIGAEDENNPTETPVVDHRTVMGNQQLKGISGRKIS